MSAPLPQYEQQSQGAQELRGERDSATSLTNNNVSIYLQNLQ